MNQFILRFTGGDKAPEQDLQLIRAQPGVTVLDETPRMLLAQAPDDAIHVLEGNLASWIITREGSTPRPKTRHQIRRRTTDDH